MRQLLFSVNNPYHGGCFQKSSLRCCWANRLVVDRRAPARRRIDFNGLPLEHAIKTVRGDGARQLAVFSDPDCPYCLVLERETLSKIDNVTIYTFLYPAAAAIRTPCASRC
jgi:hypothetical protein